MFVFCIFNEFKFVVKFKGVIVYFLYGSVCVKCWAEFRDGEIQIWFFRELIVFLGDGISVYDFYMSVGDCGKVSIEVGRDGEIEGGGD